MSKEDLLLPAPAGVIPPELAYAELRRSFTRTCGGDPSQ